MNRVFLLLVSTCWTAAESVAVDARTGNVAAEIGAKTLSFSEVPPADVMRREDSAPEVASALLSGGLASQDGAMPFFVGSWNGKRNNWYGDVGVSFVPQKDFTIVSLGRHHHNETGLQQTTTVTLWSTDTKEALAIVNIGPGAFLEGHYRWEPVDAPGVVVSQGREYRLTQACTPNMVDKWYDSAASFEEIEANAATGYARFVGGVNQSGFGYPVNTNGQFRRPGIVNFKMKPPPTKSIQGAARHSSSFQTAVLVITLLTGLARAATCF